MGLPLQTHRIEEFIRPDDFSGWNDHWVHSLYMCVCIYIYTYIYIVVANRGYSLGVVHRLFITVASLVEQRL